MGLRRRSRSREQRFCLISKTLFLTSHSFKEYRIVYRFTQRLGRRTEISLYCLLGYASAHWRRIASPLTSWSGVEPQSDYCALPSLVKPASNIVLLLDQLIRSWGFRKRLEGEEIDLQLRQLSSLGSDVWRRGWLQETPPTSSWRVSRGPHWRRSWLQRQSI